MEEILHLINLFVDNIPGIGRKNAMRIILTLLKKQKTLMPELGNILIEYSKTLKTCHICNNTTTQDICDICSDVNRNPEILCIIESLNELINFENAHLSCKYYILGEDFFENIIQNEAIINPLKKRLNDEKLKEIIIAFDTTSSGQTNLFFLHDVIKNIKPNLKITTLSRGIPAGTNIDYIDDVTIKQAFQKRLEIEE